MSTTRGDEARLTIRLSSHARQTVEDIVKRGGFRSITEALRQALGDELFLLEKRQQGWSVLLRKGNEYQEIVWPKG
jgi:Arc/MetJ-type ribon-helix-helix transcriptional regulator